MKKQATPKRPLIERRIFKHPLLGKRYFSPSYGFFKVQKLWSVSTYYARVEPHVQNCMKVQMKTDYGKLIQLTHYIEPAVWKQEFPERHSPDGTR